MNYQIYVLLSAVPREEESFSNGILDSRRHLETSEAVITECLKELIQLKLAEFIPMSSYVATPTVVFPILTPIFNSIAHVALCQVLCLVDYNLASSSPESALRKRRLDIFLESMKLSRARYDGVDILLDNIQRIEHFLQSDSFQKMKTLPSLQFPSELDILDIESPNLKFKTQLSVTSWSDILTFYPECYLGMAWTLDIFFSRGDLPVEYDYPSVVRQSPNLTSLISLFPGTSRRELVSPSPIVINFDDGDFSSLFPDESHNISHDLLHEFIY